MKIVNKDIPIQQIKISPLHWSRTITNEDVEELADNIEKLGQVHQIVVRPMGKAKRFYELLSGERRLRAQQKLGAKKVRCAIINYDDAEAYLWSLSEGLQVKRPDSTEWQKAAKLFTDKWSERYGEEEPEEEEAPAPTPKAKKNGSKMPASLGPSKRGRKKTVRGKAIDEGAKAAGVTPKTFRKAVVREENLIISAVRALEKGTISVEQADRLATLSVAEQRQQLPLMIRETQKETKTRINNETKARAEGDSAVARELLDDLLVDARQLYGKAKDLNAFLNGRDVDYPTLRRADLATGRACLQEMQELLTFVTSD
jgi:ParB-like chromosome segregation protein Spo0J